MKVALFGGTGFVGSYLIDELIKKDHKPQLLIRPGSNDKLLNPKQCNIVNGTLSEPSAIESTLKGTDAVIYNVGIIRQFPKKGITFTPRAGAGIIHFFFPHPSAMIFINSFQEKAISPPNSNIFLWVDSISIDCIKNRATSPT